MKKKLQTLFFSILFVLLLTSTFNTQVIATPSWSIENNAAYSKGVVTLTEDFGTSQIGGYLNSVPLDTRNGFTISFDYQTSGSCPGFQLIFSNIPIVLDEYAYLSCGYYEYIYNNISSHEFVNFYGLGFYNGYIIATASNNFGDHTDMQKMTSYYVSDPVYDVWHNIRAVYNKKTLTVYQDNEKLFSCPNFKPSDMSYIGFSGGNSYYYMKTATQKIRNISISCSEASLVHLNANSGTCEKESIYVLKNSKGSLPVPTRTGYKFNGWYTKKSGGTKISNTNYNFRSVQTLYAHWTPKNYTVKFNANNGTCKQSKTSVTYSKTYGKLPVPTRTGYTFSGWYTKKSGGTKITSKSKVTTAQTHTLYAHWTAKSYKITFHTNGGSLSDSNKVRTVKFNSKIGSLPVSTRTSYTFLGWYTKKSGGSKITSSSVIKGKTTYYAHWAKNSSNVTIKLNKNSGTCNKTSITTTYGGKLGSLPKATRSGYKFLGWYTKQSGGTKVTESTKTSKIIQTTKTLYAHWEKTSSSSSSSGSSSSGSSSSGTTYVPSCVSCHGSGRCSNCSGSGYVYSYVLNSNRLNCYKCNASGRCSLCHGTGKRY